MKKTLIIVCAALAVLLTGSCNKNTDQSPGDVLTVVIDLESGTKATLSDPSGAGAVGEFKFTSGDRIKVFDGTNICVGRTTSNANEATFIVESPFNNTSGSGWVAFPAEIVSGMTASGVKFTLPASYTYSQVGSSDANACLTPVPMIGTYTAGKKVTLKQAGAVVRFKFTNNEAGTLSFSFPSNVTGITEYITTPSTPGVGGITAIESKRGSVITVSNVPAGTNENPVYITLPVLNGTSPNGIIVLNNPDDTSEQQVGSISTGSELARGSGYRTSLTVGPISGGDTPVVPSFKIASDRSVVLAPGNLMAYVSSYTGGAIATATEWKFGGPFEYIGNANDRADYLFYTGASFSDMWIDLFCFQGTSASVKSHGLANIGSNNVTYHGNQADESVYSGCWDGLSISNGNTPAYTWRPLSGDEWDYLLNTRETSTLNGVNNARHARATVADVNGLLLFPDNIGSTWDTSKMGSLPTKINDSGKITWGAQNNYTAVQMVEMLKVGVVFLPAAGYAAKGKINNAGSDGRYWGSSATSATLAYALRFNRETFGASNNDRYAGRAVRLARDL